MSDAITTDRAPDPRGPYPHVRIDGDHVWVTGQIGRDPLTGDFVTGGFEPEFHQAISNLAAIRAGRIVAREGRAHLRAVRRRG